jgi:hypothetical protein
MRFYMDTEALTSRNVPSSRQPNRESAPFAGVNQPWIALFLGGGLLLSAAMRRSLPLALAGGALLYRGAAGRWAGAAAARAQFAPLQNPMQ